MGVIKLDHSNARASKIIEAVKHNILGLFPKQDWKDKIWVAGGAIQSLVSKTQVNDYDLFFKDSADVQRALDLLMGKGFVVLIETQSAIKLKKENLRVDLVLKTFDDPMSTIQEFDFTVACAAVDYDNFYATFEFFFDLASKSIAFNSLPMPIQTQKRLVKYIKKGFTPCVGAMMQLAKAINEIDSKDFKADSVVYFD
jgi:hypothetical protein